MKLALHDEEVLRSFLVSQGEKPFRLNQIFQGIYKDSVDSFEELTTIPKDLRTALEENFEFNSLKLHKELTSSEGQTTKFLLKTFDDKMIECVIMRHLSGRNTLCVSCQAGCPMACTFCATGKLGLIRNLTVSEIIDQFLFAARRIKGEDQKIRNVVFMGMGEPFLNYPHVSAALEILSGQKKIDLSSRRITISTCGIVPGIKKLALDFPQVSLALSLHAPNDAARSQIMPVDKNYPLPVLMDAIDEYTRITNKRVFYEYIMINGVTDRIEYALELARLLQGRLAHVNFIPYNPGEGIMGTGYRSTPKIIVTKFQKTLEEYGVPSTIRHTMGDDIDAACGQLALKEDQHEKITRFE